MKSAAPILVFENHKAAQRNTTSWCQVAMRNASLLVRICDNGSGIPRERLHHAASLGLKGMRERAASIRASIQIYGRRGRGSMVAIRRRLAYR